MRLASQLRFGFVSLSQLVHELMPALRAWLPRGALFFSSPGRKQFDSLVKAAAALHNRPFRCAEALERALQVVCEQLVDPENSAHVISVCEGLGSGLGSVPEVITTFQEHLLQLRLRLRCFYRRRAELRALLTDSHQQSLRAAQLLPRARPEHFPDYDQALRILDEVSGGYTELRKRSSELHREFTTNFHQQAGRATPWLLRRDGVAYDHNLALEIVDPDDYLDASPVTLVFCHRVKHATSDDDDVQCQPVSPPLSTVTSTLAFSLSSTSVVSSSSSTSVVSSSSSTSVVSSSSSPPSDSPLSSSPPPPFPTGQSASVSLDSTDQHRLPPGERHYVELRYMHCHFPRDSAHAAIFYRNLVVNSVGVVVSLAENSEKASGGFEVFPTSLTPLNRLHFNTRSFTVDVELVEELHECPADWCLEYVTLRQLDVCLSSAGDMPRHHRVQQLHYRCWEDRSTPHPVVLSCLLASLQRLLGPDYPHVGGARPNPVIAVHCHAGIGRTGVFTLCHGVTAMLRRFPDKRVDLLYELSRLRLLRDCVQGPAQLAFVYGYLRCLQLPGRLQLLAAQLDARAPCFHRRDNYTRFAANFEKYQLLPCATGREGAPAVLGSRAAHDWWLELAGQLLGACHFADMPDDHLLDTVNARLSKLSPVAFQLLLVLFYHRQSLARWHAALPRVHRGRHVAGRSFLQLLLSGQYATLRRLTEPKINARQFAWLPAFIIDYQLYALGAVVPPPPPSRHRHAFMTRRPAIFDDYYDVDSADQSDGTIRRCLRHADLLYQASKAWQKHHHRQLPPHKKPGKKSAPPLSGVEQLLFAVAAEGSADKLRLHLNAEPLLIERRDPLHLQSVLHVLARHGHARTIASLWPQLEPLQAAVDRYDLCPVHWAAVYGHADAVKLLADKLEAVECTSDCHMQLGLALLLAAMFGHLDCVATLAQRPSSPASYAEPVRLYRLLPASGAAASASHTVKQVSLDQGSPVHLALLNGHTAVVDHLLRRTREEPARLFRSQPDPLALFAMSPDRDTFAIFSPPDNTSSHSPPSSPRSTPSLFATLVAFFKPQLRDATVNNVDAPPLFRAIEFDAASRMHQLLSLANVDIVDSSGASCLTTALRCNNIDMFHWLLTLGANPRLPANAGVWERARAVWPEDQLQQRGIPQYLASILSTTAVKSPPTHHPPPSSSDQPVLGVPPPDPAPPPPVDCDPPSSGMIRTAAVKPSSN